jgi:hypothetical protein
LVCKDDSENDWRMITTAKENMARYSQQAYKDAVQAQRVQNIIMHPGDQLYEEIVDKNLIRNLNSDCDNIRADMYNCQACAVCVINIDREIAPL